MRPARPLRPQELLREAQRCYEDMLERHRRALRNIARRVAGLYGLPETDIPELEAAMHERIWRDFWWVVRARKPRSLMLRMAQQAASEAAWALLPEEQRAAEAGER